MKKWWTYRLAESKSVRNPPIAGRLQSKMIGGCISRNGKFWALGISRKQRAINVKRSYEKLLTRVLNNAFTTPGIDP